MLQCVAVCCSVMPCVAVCCIVLWGDCAYMICVGCYTVICICGVLQCVVGRLCAHDVCSEMSSTCVAVCCSVLQSVAVRCSVLQCVAVCCWATVCT